MSTQLLFSESALVLLGHLRSESRSSELWVLLGEAAQRVQAKCDLRDVAALEQIGSLENFFFWNSVLLDGSLESKTLKL